LLLSGLGAATFTWPFIEVVSLLPGLNLVFPLRFFSWVALAGAALAAFEADRLQRDLTDRRSARFAPAVGAALLALAAVLAFLSHRGDHAAAGGSRSQLAALALALASLSAFAAAPTLLGAARRFTVPVAFAGILAAELFVQGRRLYRFTRADPVPPPESRLLAFLHAQPGPFRVIGDGYVAYPNTNVLARLEEIRTHDPIERRDYVEWLDRAAGYSPAPYFKYLGDVNAPALDRLDARYFVGRPNRKAPGSKWKKVYEGPEGTLFENTRAMPRIFPSAASRGGIGGVENYRESANSASFRVRAPSEGAVLETSLVQDGGWTATSSGGRVRVFRANGPFVTLEVPPGDQVVRLRYLPPGFPEGASVTAATITLLTAAALWRTRRREPGTLQ
ncbi:MAG: YfhO family protein, partial [Thermoanaerobaculia bacterium]